MEEAAASIASEMTLTTGGAIVMTLSIASVLVLLSFCLYKVFTLPPVQ